MTGKELIEKLRVERPDVAITSHRERDDSFVWDGDGENPIEDGFYPCDVTVTAATIRKGELIEGEAYLGGSYFEPDEATGEVHGYLPQMIEEALKDLDAQLSKL